MHFLSMCLIFLYMYSSKFKIQSSEKARWVKSLATKPDDRSSSPVSHTVGERANSYLSCFKSFHSCCLCWFSFAGIQCAPCLSSSHFQVTSLKYGPCKVPLQWSRDSAAQPWYHDLETVPYNHLGSHLYRGGNDSL